MSYVTYRDDMREEFICGNEVLLGFPVYLDSHCSCLKDYIAWSL